MSKMAMSFTGAVVLLAAVQAGYSAPDSTKRADDLPIRYPGPVKPVDKDRYGQAPEKDIPDSCRNLTYCTVKPKDYPDEAIRQLFKHTKPIIRGPELKIELRPEDVVNRQGGGEEEDNCQSQVSYEPIYRLRSGNSWQDVVQAPEWAYEQKVRIEKCMNANAACFTGAGTLGLNIRTFCKQKFATWKLQVMDENNRPMLKEIELPSCCSCHYETMNKI